MQRLTLLISFLIALSPLNAQQYHHSDASLPCLDKQFTVVAHIFRDTFGFLVADTNDIKLAFEQLNEYFSPICASFQVCEFRYHNNFQYTHLNGPSGDAWKEMQIKYHADNRINVYFVTSAGPPFNGGFATQGGIDSMTAGGVVVAALGRLPHFMGHFFGLLDTWKDHNELVDGSNCATAGDQICDTPADPFDFADPNAPLYDYYVSDCIYYGQKKDANGQYYAPDVGNIMALYAIYCYCGFTAEQYRKMAETYLNSSPKMW